MIKYKKPTPYIIKGRPVKVYSEPSALSGNIINALPPETTVYAVGEENGYIQLYEDGGFVHKNNNVIIDRQTITQNRITEKIQAQRKKKIMTASLAMATSALEGKRIYLNKGVTVDEYNNTIPPEERNRPLTYVGTSSVDGGIILQDATSGHRYKVSSSNFSVLEIDTKENVDPENPDISMVNGSLYLKQTGAAAQAKEEAANNAVEQAQAYSSADDSTDSKAKPSKTLAETMQGIANGWFSDSATVVKLIGYDHDQDASKFKVNNTRSVFGFPYQFEPWVDNRLDGSMDWEPFGRKFSQKIVSRAPILIMQAGDPKFLAGFSDEDRKGAIEGLFGKSDTTADKVANEAGKYYAFSDSSVEYYRAVNDMCKSVAAMIGVGNRSITVNGHTGAASKFNWSDAASGNGGSHNFFGYYRQAVAFYVNAEPTMQDAFTNGSRQSQLASKVNQLSDQAAELQFILGGAEGYDPTGLAEKAHRESKEVAENAGNKENSGSTGILGTLIDRIDTLMAGGKLIFPEIWSDSQYTKNYNVTIKLDSPDCDPLSIYLNIFVPLIHIIAFCMPRWSAPNAYVSPFIVRAYLRSMFHVDMGIITSCDITRGTQQGWTQDGLPTEVTVNLTIKDLYNVLSMISGKNTNDVISNPAQLDYLGNLCGINVAVPDFSRTLTLWAACRNPSTALSDAILRVQSRAAGTVNNAWQNLFNKYWRM